MPVVMQSRLNNITRELPREVDDAIKQGAELVAAAAKANVPKRTGDLAAAIHVENTGRQEYTVVAGDRSAFYAHFVEFGTSHSAPHPFLVPALESSKDAIESLVAQSLRDL